MPAAPTRQGRRHPTTSKGTYKPASPATLNTPSSVFQIARGYTLPLSQGPQIHGKEQVHTRTIWAAWHSHVSTALPCPLWSWLHTGLDYITCSQ